MGAKVEADFSPVTAPDMARTLPTAPFSQHCFLVLTNVNAAQLASFTHAIRQANSVSAPPHGREERSKPRMSRFS